MRALVRKEWREHGGVLVLLCLALALALGIMLNAAKQSGSPLKAFQGIVTSVMPLMAVILVSRLVVREYMGRTQLFLETLPVSRLQVVGVKWLTGAVWLFVPLAICFVVTLFAARHQVVLNAHFIALIAIRAAAFTLMMYALFFALGLTGRYRFLIFIVLLVAAVVADQRGQLEFSQWPPFLLIQQSMVYERIDLPLQAVLTTCAMALALIVFTFALALSAQGSLVVALSRRMSFREKFTWSIVGMSVLSLVVMIDVRKQKPSFEMASAIRSESGPTVSVARQGKTGDAQALADQLSADLKHLQDVLALPVEPSLNVVPDNALDAGIFQTATLTKADGVVVRAAFNSPDFDRDGFRAYALSAWLRWYSNDRLASEERRWLLDGFTQWLPARSLPQRQEILTLRAALAARALSARQIGMDSALGQWLTTREELGACLGDALAWRMAMSLEQQLGPQGFQTLARSVFAAPHPKDMHSLLTDPSLAEVLVRAQVPPLPALALRFEKDLRADQARLGPALDQLALPSVVFSTKSMGGKAFEVHYQVGKAGAVLAPFSVRYLELGPWAGELANEALAQVDSARSGVLPASYARGTRLFTAVEQRDARLGCNVRIASSRWEVQ